MSKLISIIIPALNEEKLLPVILEQLTESSLRKKYDFEIIVSDGGSTDRTIDIAKKYADKIVYKEENKEQNISQGRNAGAKVAEGEILVFLNCDTMIEKPHEFFETIINKFLPGNYLAMTCPVHVFPADSKLEDKIFLTFYNYYFWFLNIIGLGMGRGECHVIRKSVFDELNGYDEKLIAGEDFELFKRIRRKGKILFANKLTVFESPRRYRKYGHFRILFTWLSNSISVIFTKKSLSKTWEQVR